jgi:5'-deoxynucleotidase YfbR-like HD superfamily hydrolase
MNHFVQTQSGVPFPPMLPYLEGVFIEDIAHSLAMQCRFNGHTDRFYSVAEHCVLLSHAVSPGNAPWALLHDAAEAYIGDMVFPLKEEIPQYKQIEDPIMGVICARFGLDTNQPEEVTEYDRRIVIDERDALMAATRTVWPALEGFDPLGVNIVGWSPDWAKAEFMSRFHQLFTR